MGVRRLQTMDDIHTKEERYLVLAFHGHILEGTHAVDVFQAIDVTKLTLADKLLILILSRNGLGGDKVIGAHQVELPYLLVDGHLRHQVVEERLLIRLGRGAETEEGEECCK